MELTLHDNSRVHVRWIRPGVLAIELYRPGFLKDGPGMLLKGSCYLDGVELSQLLDLLMHPPTEPPPLRPAA